MRFRLYLAILSVLLISGAAAIVFAPSKRELIVQGKPVSEWALALAGPKSTEPAKEVFKSLGPEAAPDLVRMLRTKDSFLARPLNALAPKLPSRLHTRLRRIFKIDDTVQRRYTAAMALGIMGTNATPAIPALLKALQDRSISVSMTAALNLGRIGPASLSGLLATLDDREPSARHAAMTGLIYLGSGAAPAVPTLIERLQDPVDQARARMTLQAIGKPAVKPLMNLLNHSSDQIRTQAIGILGDMGVHARAAIPRLSELARSPSHSIRHASVEALGQICRWCDPVISVLQSALEDESWDIRCVAAAQLSMEPRAANATVDALLQKIEQGPTAGKRLAIANLGFMGTAAERVQPLLKSLAVGNDRHLAELAREALERIESAKTNRQPQF